MRLGILLLLLSPPLLAQKRAITFDDYIALKSVSDPQLSPDGKWVAYTVSTPSLQDNHNVARVWVAEVATGKSRQLTGGPGSDRQPRWSPSGKATDLTPMDHDVRTIATGGDGDVAVSPDARTVAFAMRGDSVVADNTNVDICLMGSDGSNIQRLTTNPGAANPPRFSPDGKFFSYLSMERAGFEADRQRLMLLRRTDGRTESGNAIEATTGWHLSVGSYSWCPNAKGVYAVVQDRGRDNIYRIEIPSFRRSVVVSGGVNTGVQVGPDNRTLVYLHQSNTQPPEAWVSGKALSHQTDSAVATLDLPPLDEFGFIGALGDSVFGWMQKPPAFDATKKYPL